MTQRVFIPGGPPAYFPDGMSQGDIEAAVRQHLGVSEPPPPKKQEDMPEGVIANIPGALKETFGFGERPGAVPLTYSTKASKPSWRRTSMMASAMA